jgi:hypothetical protein
MHHSSRLPFPALCVITVYLLASGLGMYLYFRSRLTRLKLLAISPMKAKAHIIKSGTFRGKGGQLLSVEYEFQTTTGMPQTKKQSFPLSKVKNPDDYKAGAYSPVLYMDESPSNCCLENELSQTTQNAEMLCKILASLAAINVVMVAATWYFLYYKMHG